MHPNTKIDNISIKTIPKRLQRKYSQKERSQVPLHMCTIQNLQMQYNNLKNAVHQKQCQATNKQKLLRIQQFKNQNLRSNISQIENQFYLTKLKISLELIQKNKKNKQSPMFYNQNGLSPFQLMMLQQTNFSMNGFICMICFQDILQNQAIVTLPCLHQFHKDCCVQHLLGSKFCPDCSNIVDMVQFSQIKLKQLSQKKIHKARQIDF